MRAFSSTSEKTDFRAAGRRQRRAVVGRGRIEPFPPNSRVDWEHCIFKRYKLTFRGFSQKHPCTVGGGDSRATNRSRNIQLLRGNETNLHALIESFGNSLQHGKGVPVIVGIF